MKTWCYAVVLLLISLQSSISMAAKAKNNDIQSKVYQSPMFAMTQGSVLDETYYNIDFPRGHTGIKSFNAEVVDSSGNPVPLTESYLHHWLVGRYYQRTGTVVERKADPNNYIYVPNSGVCQDKTLGQYFGLGSETRKTQVEVPDSYGIEVGNPDQIPDGYEEKWFLTIHVIDTRDVVDKLGCTECRCDLYNVTSDQYGRPLMEGYKGGLFCCYDKTQCRLNPGTESLSRELYLRYTIEWMDWSADLLPVKIYILDVTDVVFVSKHHCQVEYQVDSCNSTGDACVDVKKTTIKMPKGGNVVYAVAEQHAGGLGAALYGKDGRVICSSVPTYGKGDTAGDEEGYIVGMSACYPNPGSVKINDRENLVFVSNYSSTVEHTGVMGVFYLLIADQVPIRRNDLGVYDVKPLVRAMNVQFVASVMLVLGAVLFGVVGSVMWWRRRVRAEDCYEPIII